MIMAANTTLRPASKTLEWVTADRRRPDLLYLGWERRQYGRHPVPVSSGFGWQYVLITRGEPTLLLERGQRKLRAGDLLIIPPSCATGWADSTDEGSEFLLWIWRTRPHCAECATAPGTHRQWAASRRLRDELQLLHARCREELEQVDRLSALTFDQLHMAIDISIVRLTRPKTLRRNYRYAWNQQCAGQKNA
jgi:hypothetical protein